MREQFDDGFSLLELMVVMVIIGLLLAAAMPAFRGFTQGNDVHSAAKSVATQVQLARERALSTGNTQMIRFMKSFQGSDYHIWDGTTANPSWKLPAQIDYLWSSGTQNSYRMTSDGRCLDSGLIILQSDRGDRDTVSVRLSGLVMIY